MTFYSVIIYHLTQIVKGCIIPISDETAERKENRVSDSRRVGIMFRVPPDLHKEIVEEAQGDDLRAGTSLNETLIFLVRTGLRCLREERQRRLQRKEDTSGNSRPEVLAA